MIYLRAWHSAAVGWVTQWIGGVGGEPFTQKNTRRRVGYAESRDLIHWSEPQIILTPDELDTNDFYALQVFRYADYYLGQLWIYDEEGAFTIDVELVWSHDGIHWERLPERPRFIPRGEFGQPDGFMIAPAQEPLVVGNEIWHYYAGYNVPHSAGGARDGTICGFRGRLRMDGFLSLQADKRLGALITRPFTLQNSSIEVNAAAHTGEIVAELVEPYYHEPQGKPIEGFSAKEFDVFRGDSLSHRLSWRGRSDLTALRGRRLMLRLSLYHAEIFSFTL
jgi:hypothetical protein